MNKPFRRASVAFIVLLIASLACALPGSGAILEDDFAGSDSNWGTGTDADSAVEYVNNTLQFDIFTPNLIVYSGPNLTQYDTVHIEVDVANNSSDPNVAFGLICNQQTISESFYYAYITPAGDYGIITANFVRDDSALVAGDTDLVPQGTNTYRLGMDCGNGSLAFYVNGQMIDSVSDSEYTSGSVGVLAWSGEEQNATSVSFDNFVITDLP